MPRFIRHNFHGRPDGWQDDVANFISYDSELPISGLQAAPKVLKRLVRSDPVERLTGKESAALPPSAPQNLGNLALEAQVASAVQEAA